jgi:hypothetical protein
MSSPEPGRTGRGSTWLRDFGRQLKDRMQSAWKSVRPAARERAPKRPVIHHLGKVDSTLGRADHAPRVDLPASSDLSFSEDVFTELRNLKIIEPEPAVPLQALTAEGDSAEDDNSLDSVSGNSFDSQERDDQEPLESIELVTSNSDFYREPWQPLDTIPEDAEPTFASDLVEAPEPTDASSIGSSDTAPSPTNDDARLQRVPHREKLREKFHRPADVASPEELAQLKELARKYLTYDHLHGIREQTLGEVETKTVQAARQTIRKVPPYQSFSAEVVHPPGDNEQGQAPETPEMDEDNPAPTLDATDTPSPGRSGGREVRPDPSPADNHNPRRPMYMLGSNPTVEYGSDPRVNEIRQQLEAQQATRPRGNDGQGL